MKDLTAHLKLDRRLAGRRGWIASDDLVKELDALPDVAEKGELVDPPGVPAGEEAAADAPRQAPLAQPEPGSGFPGDDPGFH